MPGRREVYKTTPAKTADLNAPAPGQHEGGVVFHNIIPLAPNEDDQVLERFAIWQNAFPGGSLPEFIVFEYLIGKRGLQFGLDFQYQVPFLGGRTEFGGFVMDYYFPAKAEAWMIQGERYHLLNPQDRAKNALVKAMVGSRGIRVLELWESDLLTRPDFVLDAAWYRGEEIPTGAKL